MKYSNWSNLRLLSGWRAKGRVRPIHIQGLKWVKHSFLRKTWVQRGEETNIDTKQEKLKWCPPCSLFSPTPHYHQCLLELLNLELLWPSQQGAIKRPIYLPGINWLLFLHLMATNELQSGICLHVASHKWLQLSPNAVMTNSESPFSYSGSSIPEDIYEHLELQLPGTRRKHHHHATLGF